LACTSYPKPASGLLGGWDVLLGGWVQTLDAASPQPDFILKQKGARP